MGGLPESTCTGSDRKEATQKDDRHPGPRTSCACCHDTIYCVVFEGWEWVSNVCPPDILTSPRCGDEFGNATER